MPNCMNCSRLGVGGELPGGDADNSWTGLILGMFAGLLLGMFVGLKGGIFAILKFSILFLTLLIKF